MYPNEITAGDSLFGKSKNDRMLRVIQGSSVANHGGIDSAQILKRLRGPNPQKKVTIGPVQTGLGKSERLLVPMVSERLGNIVKLP